MYNELAIPTELRMWHVQSDCLNIMSCTTYTLPCKFFNQVHLASIADWYHYWTDWYHYWTDWYHYWAYSLRGCNELTVSKRMLLWWTQAYIVHLFIFHLCKMCNMGNCWISLWNSSPYTMLPDLFFYWEMGSTGHDYFVVCVSDIYIALV